MINQYVVAFLEMFYIRHPFHWIWTTHTYFLLGSSWAWSLTLTTTYSISAYHH